MTSAVRPAPGLHTPRDVIAALGRAAIGVAMLGVGWYQASDRFRLDDQAPWLALSIAGLLVAAAGGIGWILALRRAVAAELTTMYERAAALRWPEASVDGTTADVVVLRAGAPRLFHRPGCALVGRRAVRTTTVGDELDAGREPCEACGV